MQHTFLFHFSAAMLVYEILFVKSHQSNLNEQWMEFLYLLQDKILKITLVIGYLSVNRSWDHYSPLLFTVNTEPSLLNYWCRCELEIFDMQSCSSVPGPCPAFRPSYLNTEEALHPPTTVTLYSVHLYNIWNQTICSTSLSTNIRPINVEKLTKQ